MLNNRTLSLAAMLSCAVVAHAQFGASGMKTVKRSGDFSPLVGQGTVLLEFTYDEMVVGKFTEPEYIEKKTKELNEKEKGLGDKWSKSWISDRTTRFEPKFEELFKERAEKMKLGLVADRTQSGSKYKLIIHTVETEPGYNIGISRMPAFISTQITLVEVADPAKKLAVLEINRAPGQDGMGFDYDTGGRLTEGYAKQGKELATWLGKEVFGKK